MSEPRLSTCAPWATPEDVEVCGEGIEESKLIDSLQAASDVLYELSGRLFPGECEDVVRPLCRCRRQDRRPGPCLHNLSEVALGSYPIIEVTEVLIDGAVVDPSLYRVDDHRYLVRRRDASGERAFWPNWQDLTREPPATDTFQVSFIYGTAPPPMGVQAAAALGCELAKAFSDQECKLPKRITAITRQGVTIAVLDPFKFLDEGKTGVYEADLFLKTYNPGGKRRRAAIVSPDTQRPVRRPGTDQSGS